MSFVTCQYLNKGKSCCCLATELCPTLCDPMNSPCNSPGQNTGGGSLSLLQGIFPTQGSNPGLLHSRQILYRLSHQGKPKNTGVGGLSLLQGIFPTQESNQGLLHCRQILYQLSYEGNLINIKLAYNWASLIAQLVKNPPAMQETLV